MNELISQFPTTKIVVATKPLIDKLLSMNTRNRSVNKAAINRIVDDINKDRFMLTASGVGVSNTGILLDGQHRLMAIAQAGYPKVSFVLTTGLKEASMEVIDTHSKRGIDAIMNICFNEKLQKGVSATVAFLIATKGFHTNNTVFTFAAINPRIQENIQFLSDHKENITESVNLLSTFPAPVKAAFFVLYSLDKEKAVRFAAGLNTGANLPDLSPILKLKDYVSKSDGSSQVARTALFKTTACAITKYCNDQPVQILRQYNSWSELPYIFDNTKGAPQDCA